MTATINKVYVNDWSREQWLQYRQNGIGGSDIATILHLNPFKCAAQLWLEKVGLFPIDEEDNIASFMGRYLEDQVADLWQYWDGFPESVVDNFNSGNKLNQCRRVNAYLHNPDYPELMASIDRQIIRRNGVRKNGVLECKTINGWYANQWEAGIPPQYVFQVQQYLMVTGYDYAEIAVLIDGRRMEVFEFEPDPVIQIEIGMRAVEFWSTVKAGRKIAAQLLTEEAKARPDMAKVNDLEAKIRELEPASDGSEAYEEFMKQRYSNPEGEREGTNEEWEIVKTYDSVKEAIKAEKARLQEVKNNLISHVANMEQINFGNGSKITYKPDKNGRKSLHVRLKD